MENKSEPVWLNLHRWEGMTSRRIMVRVDHISAITEKFSDAGKDRVTYTAIALQGHDEEIEVSESYDEIKTVMGLKDTEEPKKEKLPHRKTMTVETIVRSWMDAHGFNALRNKEVFDKDCCYCEISRNNILGGCGDLEARKCEPFTVELNDSPKQVKQEIERKEETLLQWLKAYNYDGLISEGMGCSCCVSLVSSYPDHRCPFGWKEVKGCTPAKNNEEKAKKHNVTFYMESLDGESHV